MGRRHPKPVVVVEVVDVVVVAVGAAGVRFIVDERAAPQDTAAFPAGPITIRDELILPHSKPYCSHWATAPCEASCQGQTPASDFRNPEIRVSRALQERNRGRRHPKPAVVAEVAEADAEAEGAAGERSIDDERAAPQDTAA